MPTGYSNTTGKPIRLGAHHTIATKNRLKATIKQRHPHKGAANGMFGRIRSEEERLKISQNTKAKMTPEICAFLSELAKKRFPPGPLNPFWKGGWVNPGYPQKFSEELKERIRVRDGKKCQICGILQEDYYERLHIHHIDGNRNSIEENNLISLCRKCHFQTRWHSLAEIMANKGGDENGSNARKASSGNTLSFNR